jgi:hypothetical protein
MWNDWELYRSTDNSMTRLMLNGMTDRGVKELTGLAKAWVSPAKMTVLTENFRHGGFDMEQKAYVVERSGKAGALQLKFDASPDTPLVHPAIVVENWPAGREATVEVAGKLLPSEKIRIGLEEGLQGDKLVVWLGVESVEPVEIKIKPRS